jgi:hypothetical protein
MKIYYSPVLHVTIGNAHFKISYRSNGNAIEIFRNEALILIFLIKILISIFHIQ